jgi:predicted negative regulator of RcsB-dependent stress response
MVENIKLLFRIYWQPAAAMSHILDRGSLLFASLAVLVLSFAIHWSYTVLLVLATAYVPGVLLIGRVLGTPAAFRRDYSPLLTCAAMAWTAANLPLVLPIQTTPENLRLILAGATHIYFGVLMFFAIRTVLGTSNGAAAAVVCLSWIPLAAAFLLWGPLRYLLGWIASPFFLFYAWYYLGGEIGSLGEGWRRRQNYQRMLQAAAVNPHDGDAQYQLGLIYQQRRQYTEAIRRFERAVEVDASETDAHFQLGRIAREQGRLHDALSHFQKVLDQDERHSQSEILRELGGMYVTVKQYQDACNELAPYIEKRPYDPEGLFYYGQALEGLGKTAEAREMYRRAIEAAATAPRYRRRFTAQWSRAAEKQLRKLN